MYYTPRHIGHTALPAHRSIYPSNHSAPLVSRPWGQDGGQKKQKNFRELGFLGFSCCFSVIIDKIKYTYRVTNEFDQLLRFKTWETKLFTMRQLETPHLVTGMRITVPSELCGRDITKSKNLKIQSQVDSFLWILYTILYLNLGLALFAYTHCPYHDVDSFVDFSDEKRFQNLFFLSSVILSYFCNCMK